MEWELDIGGMRCEMCAARVRGILCGIPGVRIVETVDPLSGFCRIEAGNLTRAELDEAFAGSGYTVRDLRCEEPEVPEGCCCGEETGRYRTPEEARALKNRLKRIEGQIRGLESMLDRGAYCIDLLNQVAAVNSALHSFSREILFHHMRSCVAQDVQAGSEEKLNELLQTLPRLMK